LAEVLIFLLYFPKHYECQNSHLSSLKLQICLKFLPGTFP
jgi:hypothetical protein